MIATDQSIDHPKVSDDKHFRFQSPYAIDRLMIDTCTYHDAHVFLLLMVVSLCTVPTVPICLCIVTMMTDGWMALVSQALFVD